MELENRSVLAKYFESQLQILQAQLEHCSMIHNQKGFEFERMCIDWIRNHLPGTFTAFSNCYIIDSHGNSTEELDIVVVCNNAPRLSYLQTNQVLAESVVAVFECKFDFSESSLKDVCVLFFKCSVVLCINSDAMFINLIRPRRNSD
jgi:hypothetical protein